PREDDLYAGSGPRPDFRQMRGRGCHRDPAVPRAGRTGTVFLERLGGQPARAGRFLRPPLQYPADRAGTPGPGEFPGGAVMRLHRKTWNVAWLALLNAAAVAGPAAGERLNFVACPVIRDTRTVPCWLSEYKGELYYLTIQSDVSAPVQPPMLGHQVLVEGVVSDAPRICGGIVLEPVRLSVMPELDANCNTMLPADDRYTIDFHPRPPGPSSGRLAF